jgi:hypothetical protein
LQRPEALYVSTSFDKSIGVKSSAHTLPLTEVRTMMAVGVEWHKKTPLLQGLGVAEFRWEPLKLVLGWETRIRT